jgi:hypothetical protein
MRNTSQINSERVENRKLNQKKRSGGGGGNETSEKSNKRLPSEIAGVKIKGRENKIERYRAKVSK